jgi:hypothetical protein
MIQIMLPLGHVFGTTGITVLVSVALLFDETALVVAVLTFQSVLPSLTVNLTSSHPSHGIIHISWSHSHCLVYVNT